MNEQGDQIGRIFAVWAIAIFGQFFGYYFLGKKLHVFYFRQKKDWATFWAIVHILIWSPYE
jgi:hypothetical protein